MDLSNSQLGHVNATYEKDSTAKANWKAAFVGECFVICLLPLSLNQLFVDINDKNQFRVPLSGFYAIKGLSPGFNTQIIIYTDELVLQNCNDSFETLQYALENQTYF